MRRRGITTYARWAPDGSRIAFNIDTGFTCTGAGCIGTCEIWHAAPSAQSINPLPALHPGAEGFFVPDRYGNADTSLGCDVLAWTD